MRKVLFGLSGLALFATTALAAPAQDPGASAPVQYDISFANAGHHEAQVVATYRDSIQAPADQWLGMIGHAGALKSSLLIVFPDDKPFAALAP